MKKQEKEALKKKRNILVKRQQKEYTTRGNTQYCQEIFKQIEEIDRLLDNEKV